MTAFCIKAKIRKKVRQLLARNGLQLPTPLKPSDSDITVPQNEQFVNDHSMQNGEENTGIGESEYKKEAPQTADVLNPGVTPKSESVDASEINIPENESVVNPENAVLQSAAKEAGAEKDDSIFNEPPIKEMVIKPSR